MAAKNDRFKRLYEFNGIQGEYMHALTSPSDDKGPALFSSGIELFICAAVVGTLFNRKENHVLKVLENHLQSGRINSPADGKPYISCCVWLS